MSMLEDTQSPEGDGYKTPTSLGQESTLASGEMKDQFALALLRLQDGLDEVTARLNRLESEMHDKQQAAGDNCGQTHPKQRIHSTSPLNTKHPRRASGGCGLGDRLLHLVSRIESIHWFYLSYPVVVYAVMRAIEGRRRSRASLFDDPVLKEKHFSLHKVNTAV